MIDSKVSERNLEAFDVSAVNRAEIGAPGGRLEMVRMQSPYFISGDVLSSDATEVWRYTSKVNKFGRTCMEATKLRSIGNRLLTCDDNLDADDLVLFSKVAASSLERGHWLVAGLHRFTEVAIENELSEANGRIAKFIRIPLEGSV